MIEIRRADELGEDGRRGVTDVLVRRHGHERARAVLYRKPGFVESRARPVRFAGRAGFSS